MVEGWAGGVLLIGQGPRLPFVTRHPMNCPPWTGELRPRDAGFARPQQNWDLNLASLTHCSLSSAPRPPGLVACASLRGEWNAVAQPLSHRPYVKVTPRQAGPREREDAWVLVAAPTLFSPARLSFWHQSVFPEECRCHLQFFTSQPLLSLLRSPLLPFPPLHLS